MSRDRLRQFIQETFSVQEISTLCFKFGVEYDGLPGDGKGGKVRELVAYAERRGRLAELEKTSQDLLAELNRRSPIVQHLRASVHDFKGRVREIAELTETLGAGRSAVICGIGGAGKTELALLVANHLRNNYPDAQLLIEMHGSDITPLNPADALTECIRAFVSEEVKFSTKLADLIKKYRDTLNNRRVIIVLDDVLDQAQVQPFLPPEGTVLLVTSRCELAVAGMLHVQLDRLPASEARLLLAGIAPRTAMPVSIPLSQLPADEANALAERIEPGAIPQVADQICYLCGDLPLALRAAGSLLAINPAIKLADYVEALRQHRFEAIGREGVEVSVEATLSSSYMHLPEEAARVLRYLAVFPGQFDTTYEEIVCDDQEHHQLNLLIRYHLVEWDPVAERARLHNLVRAFITRRIKPEERQKAAINIIASLQDTVRRYERAVFFGTCLLDPRWSLVEIRPVVLAALRQSMHNRPAEKEQRNAALLLTHLKWLDKIDVSPDEMSDYLDLIDRYIDLPDERRYLIQHISAILDSKAVQLSERQQARLFRHRASLLGKSGQLDEAEKDYTEAQHFTSEFIHLAAKIYLGTANIVRLRAERPVEPRDQARQRVELLRAEHLYTLATKLAEVYGEDVILEVNIYKEASYNHALLGEWDKAEEDYSSALTVLEKGQQQISEPEIFVLRYAAVLEVATDVHLKKGHELATMSNVLHALAAFETAYRLAWREIVLLKKHFGKFGDIGLVYAHINAGDSLWEMSNSSTCHRSQPRVKACRHWHRARYVALRLGILDMAEDASELFRHYSQDLISHNTG